LARGTESRTVEVHDRDLGLVDDHEERPRVDVRLGGLADPCPRQLEPPCGARRADLEAPAIADEAAALTVVETETEKLICEPKRADDMQDSAVLAKARAAATWCKHATAHEMAHGGKPCRYLLIPHHAIADNMSLDGLAKRFAFAAPEERE